MTAIEKPEDSEKTEKTEVTLPPETLTVFGGDELRARVFYEKYALRDASGKQVELTPDKLWLRVARELASVEEGEKKQEWTGYERKGKFHTERSETGFVCVALCVSDGSD